MTEDWADALVALLATGARFMVVGAHALAVHGVPRATQDLDVWIDPTKENADRVWSALAQFGPPLEAMGVMPADFQRPGTVIQIGLPPHRIDVHTEITGVSDFATAWEDRVEREANGTMIPFLGRETLLRNKRAVGRLKDLADVEALGERP